MDEHLQPLRETAVLEMRAATMDLVVSRMTPAGRFATSCGRAMRCGDLPADILRLPFRGL